MPEKNPHRIRLKLPDGAEFEAEGTPEFIAGERGEFIRLARPTQAGGDSAKAGPGRLEPAWETISETKGRDIALRAKLSPDEGGEKEACLILIAAARAILKNPKPTAAQMAKWLRLSGYPVGRIDRALQPALDRGDLLASGARRARRYELSGPGLAKAFRLAERLAQRVGSPPK